MTAGQPTPLDMAAAKLTNGLLVLSVATGVVGLWSLAAIVAHVPGPVGAPLLRSLVLLFGGISVALLVSPRRGRVARWIGLAAGAVTALAGVTGVAATIHGFAPTLDGAAPLPGALPLFVVLLSRGVLVCPLVGIGLVLAHLPRPGTSAPTIAGVASWLATLELMSALYARPGGPWSGVALGAPAAVLHLLLALALVLASGDVGIVRLLASRRMGGRVARRLLPATVAASLLLQGLMIQALRMGLFGEELGVSFLMATAGFLAGGVVLWRSGQLEREEAARRRVEDAVKQSEERFKALVEHGSDAIVLLSADGTTLYQSPSGARIVGTEPGSRVGQNGLDRVHPDDLARVQATLAECLREPGVLCSQVFRLRRTDDTFATVEAVATNRLDDPAVRAVVVNYRDVSDRHRLEEELRQSQKMLAIGQLAGGVAHDFNNLLGVMLGHADLLDRKLASSSGSERRHLRAIRAAAERGAALTRQLLAFSRKQLLSPKVLDLNEVVNGVAPMLRRLIGEDLDFELRLAPALPAVKADPGQLDQVLLNLAVNARDAMPDGGSLLIETAAVELDEAYVRLHHDARPGLHVALLVSDTGTGMDAATLARVFEPFFTTKPVGKGTGLGLATVYGIVRQSGGHVTVYSEPGRGSAFKVYLPAFEGALVDPTQAPAEPARGGAETILVVEDEPSLRSIVGEALTDAGYTALVGGSPAAAFALAEAHQGRIDLLLTDVVMPAMNGREVARRLSELRPGLRVLYMSGYTAGGIGQQQTLEPGVSFLPKPFTVAALLRRVREVLDGEHGGAAGA